MTDEQIKKAAAGFSWVNLNCDENRNSFARAIESAAASPLLERIAALTASLKKANDQAEHFEREWYLRGDEIEAALPAMREYARKNPKHHFSTDGTEQDPNGAHAWLERNDKPSTEVAQAPNAQQAEAQEPCANPLIPYLESYKTMARMASEKGDDIRAYCYHCMAVDIEQNMMRAVTRPQPAQLQALSATDVMSAWMATGGLVLPPEAMDFARSVQSALAAKNWAVLAAAAMAPEEAE